MRALLVALPLLALAAPAVARASCVVPPVPPTWKSGEAAWERAVRRCYERPTKTAQRWCLEDLYRAK